MSKRARKRYRRYVLRGLLILVCIVVGWYVVNRIVSGANAVKVIGTEGAQTQRAAFSGRLRIAAYNIAHGRGTASSNWQLGQLDVHRERLRAIGRLLSDEKLDLVVLNEVDFDSVWSGHVNQAEVIGEEGGFPFRAEQREVDTAVPFVSVRFGNALLSRYPIIEAHRTGFGGDSIWRKVLGARKRALLCEIALTSTQHISVLALHLPVRSERVRVQWARAIAALRGAADAPLVLAGDFNSTPVDFPCATLDPEGTTAMSVLFESGRWKTLPTGKPAAHELTFSTIKPQSVIDWILIPRDWKIISKKVIGGELSDHYAVIMEVEVGSEG